MSEIHESEQINEYIAALEIERNQLKGRLAFLEAENERLRLPYVMRDEPPDREGEYLYSGTSAKRRIVVKVSINGDNICCQEGTTTASIHYFQGLWGSAPLPVGEGEG